MASMSLSIQGMSGASFAMQENIYTGTVTGQFTLNGDEIQTNSWVSSNDTTNNFLFTQFTYSGTGTQAVTVSLAPGNGNTYPTSTGSSGSVLYINVAGDSTATVGGYNTRQVRVAVGVVGATGTISGSTLQFTLSPGVTVTLVSSIMSNYDSSSYTTQSISNVSGSTASSVSSELSSDESWWANFWDASYVEIASHPVLQEEYYGSLYLLASSSEPNTAPPGLWGPWVEANPAWAGDYTVKQVDISTDFGATWTKAKLENPKNKYDWQRWTATVKLPSDGYFEIWTRGTDSRGIMQPHVAGFWNPQGYGGNPMHRIAVLVG